ncbi:MAG: hypothetical protein RLZZ136_1836, partial [Pseudomonadota bacterium]
DDQSDHACRQPDHCDSGPRRKKLGRLVAAVAMIWVAASMIGLIINGIGWGGIVIALFASAMAFTLFARYPRFELPSRSSLAASDTKALVGRTELWLESQRRTLPPPAVKLVNHIGLQLDALGLQLSTVDPAHPAMADVRQLVGEHLPGVVDGYQKIPEHLRYEPRGGSNPNQQFMEALGLISTEIDSATRQLASGAIDDLAIKTRYLDYKYGGTVAD